MHTFTNCDLRPHSSKNAQNIGVTLNSGEQLQADLIGLDIDTDLAVIKIGC